MDKLVARKPLYFSLLSTSQLFLIDQNIFYLDLSDTVSQYLMTRDLTAVGLEINNLDISVAVQELQLTMNLALNGLL